MDTLLGRGDKDVLLHSAVGTDAAIGFDGNVEVLLSPLDNGPSPVYDNCLAGDVTPRI